MKKFFLFLFFLISSFKTSFSEEPNVLWNEDILVISISGNITHGDKMRFILKKNQCNTIHHSFTFYTYSKNKNFNKLEDKVLEMTLNKKPFQATVLFSKPFLLGTVIWFNVGSFPFKDYVLELKNKANYEIKIINSKNFVAKDYFDIDKNIWNLKNIDKILYTARQECIKKSKTRLKPKLV